MIKNKKILLVNKPKNMTSNDVCQKLKRKYGLKKIGHAGTLDPNATGLLILGINDGTKLLGELILENKEYIATIKFGVQTETYDIEGKITKSTNEKVDINSIDKILEKYNHSFFYQKPPIYSAIKIKGKKLYDYARNNENIEILPRKVAINSLKKLSFDYENQILKVLLNVSKGFYVRSFANDLGLLVNNYAFLYDLHRTKSGDYKIEDAYDLEFLLNYNFNK